MKSVMRHQFSRVPKAEIPRSKFNRSFGYKTTLEEAGILYPIYVDEMLPGDTFKLKMQGLARLATPIAPIMDNMYMETFFFAVPNRLLWTNWKKFHGEQSNPGDSTDFLVPQVTSQGGFTRGSIADYFGLPLGVPNTSVNALPFRAYSMIWDEWFRDENLQDAISLGRGDGPDGQSNYSLKRRGKRFDYFTSCLPFPQKGPGVDLPLGSIAPVKADTSIDNGKPTFYFGQDPSETPFWLASNAAQPAIWNADPSPTEIGDARWVEPALYADLTQATASTINEIRQAFQIQRLLERDARGGTRYTEIIRSHFGVTSPDARLQRPEYLGGGSSPVNINPIAQTSGTAPADGYTPTPQGNLAAIGTASLNGHGFTYSATEHCTIIGLIAVRADLTYQRGIDRMWLRQTRFDYYYPALARLGEQAVLNKEIFAQGTAEDDEVFGYQERYAEYRYANSKICGKMRSTDPQSLDFWHLSQDFETLPVLNDTFIQENPPVDRVIAVPSEPQFIFDSFFDLQCVRPMPLYGVPGMIDHF